MSRLIGRRIECEVLTRLVAASKAGRSQVLVVSGEAGIGKTALLEFLVESAAGCTVARAAGVESEMELAYAGLHQLCSPYLDALRSLPDAQQDALRTAFRLQPGPAPDRALVGVAVLNLLSTVAEERPLTCVVDDAQWLDQASAQTLEFVARRLEAEPLAMVLAVRGPTDGGTPRQLPTLVLRGLDAVDAAALLDSAVPFALDPRVRDRILAESGGNPLALLELPHDLSAAHLVFGGAANADGTPVVRRLERVFLRQVRSLPEASQRLLLLAAAEPTGDLTLLGRAAVRLGISPRAAAPAVAVGLIELRDRVTFRHPLVRSAVYRSAAPPSRREVHAALAEVTDPVGDADRRAWHHARAAVAPDEDVAAELERSAGRAFAHGGLAAAAAFLDRAAALTPDPGRRVGRSIAAAGAKASAGSFEEASALLTVAASAPLGEGDRARIELVRAEISFAAHRGNEALPLLLAAARRFERLDPRLARDTYLDAMSAALFAGRLADGAGAREVAEAVRVAPPPDVPRKGDALLDALAVRFTEGYGSAAHMSLTAVHAFAAEELALDEAVRFAWLAVATASSLWDDVTWDVLTRRHLEAVRNAGALSALPLALHTRAVVALFAGDLAVAASLVEEARSVVDATRTTMAPYGDVGLAALQGHEDLAERLAQACLDEVVARGEGVGVNFVQWARALLRNGLGRYDAAFEAARDAAAVPLELGVPQWALAELVEAGVRSGETGAAARALEELSVMARASGTDWALGVAAGRRALLMDGAGAEELYCEAIERLARTRMRLELARVQLLHGEWLRREGRRVDARATLRTAHRAFTAMGAHAFADRAGRELLATGESVRKRTPDTTRELTSQEAHIARLAVQGLTNAEIGVALFISPRTVEWHLRKIFSKLGVGTRRQLRLALRRSEPSPARALGQV
jgi:DNA-binding CsgD family transcriptional regulator